MKVRKGFTITLAFTLLFALLMMVTAGCGEDDKETSKSSKGKSSSQSAETKSDEEIDDNNSGGENTEDVSGSASNKSNNAKSSKSTSSKTKSSKSTSSKASSGTTTKKTVQFATWEDIANTEYGPVVTAFTKKTGIKVQIVRVTQGDYVSKLSARIAANNSPDVFKENGEFPRMFPLARPITDGGINPKDSFWDQQSVAMNTVNGVCYAVASKQEMFQARFLVYYNKKLFAEAGISTPEDYVKANNWTWDTLLTAATQIKAQKNLTVGATINPDAFVAAYGGGYVKYKNGAFYSGLDGTDGINLTDVWRHLLEGNKSSIYQLGGSGGSQDFSDGKIGIAIHDSYGLKSVGYFRTMKDSEVGFTYLPKKSKSDSAYPSSGWILSFGLLKGSKNPEAAGEFLRYYLDMDNYDMSLTYKNSAAEKFAYEICDIPIANNLLLVGYGTDKVAKSGGYFRNQMSKADPNQISTAIGSLKNVVDPGVKACNNLLNQAGK